MPPPGMPMYALEGLTNKGPVRFYFDSHMRTSCGLETRNTEDAYGVPSAEA